MKPISLCIAEELGVREQQVAVAPGFNLLGVEPARCGDGLGCVYLSERRERRDGGDSRSHKLEQIPHRDTFAKHNLLTRGQEIVVVVDLSKAVRLDLEPGEISLHHVQLVHGSPPNTSDDRRIGFAIRYIPAYVRQLFGDDTASLVRGEDCYGHFELEPRPERDMDPDMLALHQAITERNAKILYRGTDVESYNEPRAVGQR